LTALLEVEGLHAGYGSTEILRDVSFEVGGSEVVCVMGRNGAGKTTLLRALMGVLPKRGSVRLDGVDVSGWSGNRIHRAGVSWVPQEASVFPGLTVREHLGLAAGDTPGDTLEAAASLFPVLGERLDQEAQTLSGGERKMLGIAQALASRPRLILMDEPTEGVAPVVVQQLIPAIAEIRHRTAVVLVEQNVDTAVALGESAIVLELGMVVERGSVAELHDDGVLERRLAL
jgi:branched-chain amino acid transport system ATP-binding protein